MDSFKIISIFSILLALFFGNPNDLLSNKMDGEYEDKSIGKFSLYITSVLAWFGILYLIWIVFVIIKVLWKLA